MQNNPITGVLFMLSAMFVFSSVNAIAKDAMGQYSLFQIIFFRNFFSLFPMFYLMMKEGGPKILKTNHFKSYLFIGVVGMCALTGLFGSLKYLPLAEAVSIHFSEIFIITALSAIFLKEAVGLHRWVAISVGFVGVLIIFRPAGDVLNIGAIFGLIFAVCDAIYMLYARILTRTDSPTAVVIYFTAIVSLFSGAFLPWFWETPNFSDFIRLVILGVGGGVGQYWLTQAYRHAEAAVVSPMIYSALIWNILFGYAFWGHIPDSTLILGAGLIVGSGIYIIFRESRMKEKAA